MVWENRPLRRCLSASRRLGSSIQCSSVRARSLSLVVLPVRYCTVPPPTVLGRTFHQHAPLTAAVSNRKWTRSPKCIQLLNSRTTYDDTSVTYCTGNVLYCSSLAPCSRPDGALHACHVIEMQEKGAWERQASCLRVPEDRTDEDMWRPGTAALPEMGQASIPHQSCEGTQ